jgi:hypothetical protein
MSNHFGFRLTPQVLAGVSMMLLMQPVYAAGIPRQAILTGGAGGAGRCAIEVDVDGAAEIEITSATGILTTVSGREADWRRFQCSEPMPRNPGDFQLVGVSGRGRIRVLRDPRNGAGTAVIRIDDPQSGSSRHAFDLQWRMSGGRGGWQPVPPPVPPGRGPGPGTFPPAKAIRICQDAVTHRLSNSGYRFVTIERAVPDNNPGRNDRVIGTARGKRGFENVVFSFSCSVDFRSGTLRSVDVQRR